MTKELFPYVIRVNGIMSSRKKFTEITYKTTWTDFHKKSKGSYHTSNINPWYCAQTSIRQSVDSSVKLIYKIIDNEKLL